MYTKLPLFKIIIRLICRLILNKGTKTVTAQVQHYKAGVVLEASTAEWSLQKQLYRPYDSAAYINLGRVSHIFAGIWLLDFYYHDKCIYRPSLYI